MTNIVTGIQTHYRKIKVKDSFVHLDYYSRHCYEDGEFVTDTMGGIFGHPPHPDLVERIDALKAHLAFLCEYTDAKPESLDDIFLQKFKVTGVILTGLEPYETCQLIGYRHLVRGGVLNLITPKCFYENIEHYPHVVDLFTCIHLLIEEVEEYQTGKYGEGAQMEMFEE